MVQAAEKIDLVQSASCIRRHMDTITDAHNKQLMAHHQAGEENESVE